MVLFVPETEDGEQRRGSHASPRLRLRGLQFPPGTVPRQTGVVDANPGTFYSAMSNGAFEMATVIRGRWGFAFHSCINTALSDAHGFPYRVLHGGSTISERRAKTSISRLASMGS